VPLMSPAQTAAPQSTSWHTRITVAVIKTSLWDPTVGDLGVAWSWLMLVSQILDGQVIDRALNPWMLERYLLQPSAHD
jgi:hypothetical protein